MRCRPCRVGTIGRVFVAITIGWRMRLLWGWCCYDYYYWF